jgi:hypothetical protein
LPALAVLAGLIALALVLLARGDGNQSAGPSYTVPASIPADCSRPVEMEVMAFLDTVPNDSTVQFQPDGCYAQNTVIRVYDRRGLVIDGKGSTFKKVSPSTPHGTGAAVNPNWRVAGGSNITLQNLTILGAFRAEPNPGNQHDHGVSLWGVRTAKVLNARIRDVDGDFIGTDPDLRTGCDASRCPLAFDVTIDRLRGQRASRQGVSFTGVDGAVLSNSSIAPGPITATGGNGIDLEIDVPGEILRNIRVIDNRIGEVRFSGVAFVPGASPEVGNVEILGNEMTVPPTTCSAGFTLGSTQGIKSGVIVKGNTILTQHDGIWLEQVAGEVTGNLIRKTIGTPLCEPPAATHVRKVGSTATVCGNRILGFPEGVEDPPCARR